eukprot:COSAG06_NODE_58061_length_278_cov_0.581006_1_plen_51_part_00
MHCWRHCCWLAKVLLLPVLLLLGTHWYSPTHAEATRTVLLLTHTRLTVGD